MLLKKILNGIWNGIRNWTEEKKKMFYTFRRMKRINTSRFVSYILWTCIYVWVYTPFATLMFSLWMPIKAINSKHKINCVKCWTFGPLSKHEEETRGSKMQGTKKLKELNGKRTHIHRLRIVIIPTMYQSTGYEYM